MAARPTPRPPPIWGRTAHWEPPLQTRGCSSVTAAALSPALSTASFPTGPNPASALPLAAGVHCSSTERFWCRPKTAGWPALICPGRSYATRSDAPSSATTTTGWPGPAVQP
eukprot:258239_1